MQKSDETWPENGRVRFEPRLLYSLWLKIH